MENNNEVGKAHFNNTNEEVVIEENADEIFDDRFISLLKRFPKQTWTVLATELFERFSYYGVKTVLVLYLYTISTANNEQDKRSSAKTIYHAFSMTSYFTGVLGAMVADSWLGKFRTIFWSLLVYCCGEIVLTLTTVPSIGNKSNAGPLIGLFVAAIASGNIKPCMAAFGGDQLPQKDTGLISKFFALFYMSVNVGAMLTMIFVPMIRTDIRCFGGNCYPVVFGVSCVVIILATVSFFIGSNWYMKVEPEGNMLIKVIAMIHHAFVNKRRNKEDKQYPHWLYYAEDKYEKSEIEDVRVLLRVLTMYIPLPVFWALFLQQGSSWTLQAQQMNGDLGGGQSLRSDQMQFFNPVIVLILIPLYDTVIYPCLNRCNLGLSPLKRMTIGMILAAVAFAVSGFMQIKIQDVQPLPTAPPSGQTSLDFINISPCESVEIDPYSYFKLVVPYGQHSSHQHGQAGNRSFIIRGNNCYSKKDHYENDVIIFLKVDQRQSVFIDVNTNTNQMEARIVDHDFPSVSVTTANTRVRTIFADNLGLNNNNVTLTYKHAIENDLIKTFENLPSYNNRYEQITAEEYEVQMDDSTSTQKISISNSKVALGTFGAYTITITKKMHQKEATNEDNDYDLMAHVYEDVASTSVHRIWQLPQYIIITAGEVMFAVTGLEFAYSQSPPSMKSVLQAFWLFTNGLGDLIVVILSIAKPVDGVEKEMFLYGAIMLVVSFIFAVMSYFYTYSDYSGKMMAVDSIEEADNNGFDEEGIDKSSSTTQL